MVLFDQSYCGTLPTETVPPGTGQCHGPGLGELNFHVNNHSNFHVKTTLWFVLWLLEKVSGASPTLWLPFLSSKPCHGLTPRMLTCEEQPPLAFHGPKMNHVTFIPQIRQQVRSYCFWTTATMWFTEQRIGTIQSSEYVTKLEGISKHENMQHFGVMS